MPITCGPCNRTPGPENAIQPERCAVTYHPASLTTREIAETCHYGNRRTRDRYAIPVAGALELPEITLPIPPYVLGVWLGDGHSTSTRITAHKDDLEIADHLRAAARQRFALLQGLMDSDGHIRTRGRCELTTVCRGWQRGLASPWLLWASNMPSNPSSHTR